MHRPPALQALSIAALTVLVPWGANYMTDPAPGDVSPNEINSVVVETEVESCVGMGDVFQLDVPGTYTAFAVNSSGSLLTEVWESGGELLATSHPAMATTRAVDVPSGLRFGVAAPQVFEVESNVTIQVQHEDAHYELFLIRIGNTPDFSRFDVRPPVERVANEPGSCPAGETHETFKIHTDAVYSDTSARQVFVIDSPNGSPTAERQTLESADRYRSLLMAWRSVARGHLLYSSRFFATL